ncbi:MAG: AAA family ATPase [Nanoarchaeota archaeon]|nr:AAA family ATPase [Nanoarchaeota archaeon]
MVEKTTKGISIDGTVTSLITDKTIESYIPRIMNYAAIKQKYTLDQPITADLLDKKTSISQATIYELIIYTQPKVIPRNTTSQVVCLESLEDCLATYLNHAETLGKGIEEQDLVNTYSLFRGAAVAKDHIRSSGKANMQETTGISQLNLSLKSEDLTYDVLKVIFKGVETTYAKHGAITDDMLLQIFDTFYTQVINQCLAESPQYAEKLKEKGMDSPQQIKDLIFTGFKAKDKREKELAFPDTTLEDIVGNLGYIEKGKRLIKNVLAYSFDAPNGGTNPKMPFTQILTVYGGPGTGKTITAYAMLNEFKKLAKENNIPSFLKAIRKSDWTSSYQYATAQNLVRTFQDEVFNNEGLVGVYWPDFDTAFVARNSPDIRAEEKDNLNVLFGLLDGSIGPRNGKWFIILDANYLDTKSMDAALFSRVMEEGVEVKGPEKPEHYIRLFKDILLKKQKDFLDVKPEEWEKFGETCIKNQLSGRAIEKISKQVSNYISHFEEPEGFFKMSHEDKMKVIQQNSKKADLNFVLKTTQDYCDFQKIRDDNEALKNSEENLKELLSQLSEKH